LINPPANPSSLVSASLQFASNVGINNFEQNPNRAFPLV
jgi:hypothetical protein